MSDANNPKKPMSTGDFYDAVTPREELGTLPISPKELDEILSMTTARSPNGAD